jgi:RND family efflux transporter MFP subunit
MKLSKKIRKIHSSWWTFPALICLTVVLTVLVTSCGKEEDQATKEVVRPVKTMTITPSGDVSARTYPGRVRASQRVDLAFQVSGPLIKLTVEEGQQVKKGQLLARIDPRDFETDLAKINSDIGRARANLEAMQVGARPEDIKILEAEIEAAKARLLNAEHQYKRYRDLYIRKQVSKADFDLHKSERDIAKANLNTTIQNLEKGKAGARKEDIEAMQATIRGLEAKRKRSQDALDDTYLQAPFSGVIAKRYVENFEEVKAKQSIVSLDDISHVEILVDVPEIVVATIKGKRSMVALAEFAAAPGKQYPLSLKEFSTRADPRTQTYQVTLQMRQPEGINILPGMTASVVQHRPKEEDDTGRFVIPAIAVFADEAGNSHAWVVDRDTMTVHRRKVTTGELTGTDSIQILDGLQSGEMIAISGVSRLREGMKVRHLEQ